MFFKPEVTDTGLENKQQQPQKKGLPHRQFAKELKQMSAMVKQCQIENRLQDVIAQSGPPDVVKEAQESFSHRMLVGTDKYTDVEQAVKHQAACQYKGHPEQGEVQFNVPGHDLVIEIAGGKSDGSPQTDQVNGDFSGFLRKAEEIKLAKEQTNQHVSESKDKGNGHVFQKVRPGIHDEIDGQIPGDRGGYGIFGIQGIIIVVDLPAQRTVAYKEDSRENHIEQQSRNGTTNL